MGHSMQACCHLSCVRPFTILWTVALHRGRAHVSYVSPAVVAGFSPLEPPGHTQYILIFNFFILSEWIYNVVFFSAVQESDSDIAKLRRYPWVVGGGHGHPLQYPLPENHGQRSLVGYTLCVC